MTTQERIALPTQLADAILAHLKKRPWEEVNDLVAPMLNTAMKVNIQMPEPMPVAKPPRTRKPREVAPQS